MQPQQTTVAFAARELEHYHQLLTIVDPEGRGIIEAVPGATFLLGSGLHNDILRRVWEIADSQGHGFLGVESFFVALRLVAHAQAGRDLDPQLATLEPPALPDFHGSTRHHGPSESSRPGSDQGGRASSNDSDMQPIIASEEQVLESARLASQSAARRASRSATPVGRFLHERWAPSRRELRKYAALFRSTDWDQDGFVLGGEAQVLLERSRLTQEQLAVAWEHADRDKDGRLNFPEFVCLVHLVTCAVRGAQLPGLGEELPSVFLNALASMDRCEVLAAERDTSRSRSASPKQTMLESVTPPPPRSPREAGPFDGWATETMFPTTGSETTAAATVHVQISATSFNNVEGAAHTSFGSTAGGHVQDPTDGGFGAAMFDTGFTEFPSNNAFGLHEQMDKMGGSQRDLKVAADEQPVWDSAMKHDGKVATDEQPVWHGAMKQDSIVLDKAVEQFHAVASADQAVSQNLRVEVDELDGELARLSEEFVELDRQVQQEQRGFQQLEHERHRLEAQQKDMRQHVGALYEQRRKMDLECLSLHRDRKHLAGEQAFLQQMTIDEEATLSVLGHANKFLERSERELEAHVELLERERRELLREAGREKEMLQAAERQNAELRGRLERLKRDAILGAAERCEHGLRDGRARPDGGRQGELTLPNGSHTWAPVVATASRTAVAGSISAEGPAGMPLSTLLRSREGV